MMNQKLFTKDNRFNVFTSSFFSLVFLLVVLSCFAPGLSFGEENYKLVKEPIFDSRVYIEEHGKDNEISLVLVHGTGDLGAKIWDSTIAFLKDDFHILTFDLPGFGRSEKKNELYSPENYSRFLHWLINAYAKDNVYLIGHSMGGAISLYYAGVYPRTIERLILVDAAGILHRTAFTKNVLDGYFDRKIEAQNNKLAEKPLSALKDLVGSTIESVDNSLMPEDMGSMISSKIFRAKALKGDPVRISGMAMITTDYSRILGKVSAPTVLIWGEEDEIAPLRTGKLLACNIKLSSLFVLKGLKHNPMLEDKESFNSLLLQTIIETNINLYPKVTWRSLQGLKKKDRIVENKNDFIITGDYTYLSINNSRNVTIKDAIIDHLKIDNSYVSIENSQIGPGINPIEIKDSQVKMTGVHAKGVTTIKVYNSSLDLAGTHLAGEEAVMASDYESSIVFSVCKIDSPLNSGYAHKVIKLRLGDKY